MANKREAVSHFKDITAELSLRKKGRIMALSSAHVIRQGEHVEKEFFWVCRQIDFRAVFLQGRGRRR